MWIFLVYNRINLEVESNQVANFSSDWQPNDCTAPLDLSSQNYKSYYKKLSIYSLVQDIVDLVTIGR